MIVAALPHIATGLGGVAARLLDTVQVITAHVAGDVLAVETGGVEFLDLRIAFVGGLDEVVQVLVDDLVGADGGGDLFFGAAVAKAMSPHVALKGDLQSSRLGG